MSDGRNRRAGRTQNNQQPYVPTMPPRMPAPAGQQEPVQHGHVPPYPQPQPQTHQPAPRNARSQARTTARRPAWARVLPYLILPVALLIALAFLLQAGASTKAQINAIQAKRAADKAEHERLIGYYVSMRRVSGVYDLIKKYAAEYEVHPSFVSAVIARESHYDPYAESSVGARGLMQIMEDTGQDIADRLGFKDYQYAHLTDPDVNIRFGTWYLSQLSSQFAGNPVMIASAYHAGASNVKLWAMRLAEDQKTISLDQIPMADTLDYVSKVMNAYALYYAYDAVR